MEAKYAKVILLFLQFLCYPAQTVAISRFSYAILCAIQDKKIPLPAQRDLDQC
jgi:hypothetical protein